MTNREKYQKQIDEFLCNHAALVNGVFRPCDVRTKCKDCDYLKMNKEETSCYRFIKAWLDMEVEDDKL